MQNRLGFASVPVTPFTHNFFMLKALSLLGTLETKTRRNSNPAMMPHRKVRRRDESLSADYVPGWGVVELDNRSKFDVKLHDRE